MKFFLLPIDQTKKKSVTYLNIEWHRSRIVWCGWREGDIIKFNLSKWKDWQIAWKKDDINIHYSFIIQFVELCDCFFSCCCSPLEKKVANFLIMNVVGEELLCFGSALSWLVTREFSPIYRLINIHDVSYMKISKLFRH